MSKFNEKVLDLIFKCYPKDMENFETMTENQAYRLLQKLWDKLENK